MYYSPTYGKLDIEGLKKRMISFLTQKNFKYRIIVGCDSQKVKKDSYDFVVAIAIHRIGFGGIYFWQRLVINKKMSLKERMYQESIMSLESAEDIFSFLRNNGIAKYNIEIHVDIGRNGETREMINEIVGMVRSNGYQVMIKPDSFAASKVADRHT